MSPDVVNAGLSGATLTDPSTIRACIQGECGGRNSPAMAVDPEGTRGTRGTQNLATKTQAAPKGQC